MLILAAYLIIAILVGLSHCTNKFTSMFALKNVELFFLPSMIDSRHCKY